MPPSVSVVIPLYNPGPLLEVAIKSLQMQTAADLEIIPVDDAGPEPLRERLEALARADARIKPVFHDSNRGLSGALNSGIAKSTGDYLLVFEQDCELKRPDALEKGLELASANPKTCLTGLRELPVGEMRPAEVAFTALRGHMPDPASADLQPCAFSELKCDLFPRSALEAAGGFDEAFRFSGEDQMFGHKVREAGFTLVRSAALTYVLRSGTLVTVGSNLRREFTYGRTQAALVLATAVRSVRSTAGVSQGRARLLNRVHAVASGMSLAVFLPVWALTGFYAASLLLLAPTLIRVAVVAARARALGAGSPDPGRALALAAAVTPLDDLVYTSAFAYGALSFALSRRA